MKKWYFLIIVNSLICQVSISQNFYGIDISNPKIKNAILEASKNNNVQCGTLSSTILKSSVIGCNFNNIDDTSHNNEYIPTQNSPLIIVRINCHIMQKKDGSGNFKNNSTDLLYIKSLFDEMNKIYSKLAAPLNGGVTGTLNVIDTKIRFELSGIYFHQNDTGYNNNGSLHSNYCFQHYAINVDKELNLFLCELPSNNNIIGIGNGLLGSTSNYEINMNFYRDYQQYPPGTFGLTHFGGQPWITVPCVCHETGHCLGLYHTFQPDELSDTPSPDIGTWCSPSTVQNCNNNIMSYSNTRNNFSPLQIGKMRKLITTGWRSLEQNNCLLNIPQYINNNTIWDMPRAITGDIYISNSSQLTIQCNTYFPQKKTLYVQNLSKLILDGGQPTNTCDDIVFIQVEDGGYLQINSSTLSNCIITIQSGGTLKIIGDLTITGNHSIDIESGAYICIETGATINLTAAFSVINLHNGYLIGTNPNVITNTNCSATPATFTKTGLGTINTFTGNEYIQNQTYPSPQKQYYARQTISAGTHVTDAKPQGPVVI